MGDLILSALVIAAAALLFGAFKIWRRGGNRRQMALMIAAALVMIANVAIWTAPTKDGRTLAGGIDATAD